MERLERLRFGADRVSQARAALELIALFEAAAQQAGACYPAKFMAAVANVYETYRREPEYERG